jgi:hypothetical protein
MTINLPPRPSRYGFGPDMPVGSITVQQIDDGSGNFTVARVVDGETWLPLDGRDNPAWLIWPSAMETAAWVHEAAPVEDYPHWGATPT